MPRGIIPDHRQPALAWAVQLAATLPQALEGKGRCRVPRHKAWPDLLGIRPQQARADRGFGLRILLVGRFDYQPQRLPLRLRGQLKSSTNTPNCFSTAFKSISFTPQTILVSSLDAVYHKLNGVVLFCAVLRLSTYTGSTNSATGRLSWPM